VLSAPAPGTAQQLTLEKARVIRTTPFVNSTSVMKDNEGLAYVPVNNTIWLADDGADGLWEVDKDTGFLLSFIPRSQFNAAPRLGTGELPGSERTGDFESMAYDSVNDVLYVFSGACCPKPPTAFRLTRTSPTQPFHVDSWQPLPPELDPGGATFHPTEGLYLTDKTALRNYDYVTNTVGPLVSVQTRGSGSMHGMGFSPDGTKLWVVTARDEVYRIDWATKLIDADHIFKLTDFALTDGRGVEIINGQLYINDGEALIESNPDRFAVTVFNIALFGGPSAPSGLAGVVGSNRVDLTWTDTSGNETGFQVQRCDGTCVTSGTFTTIATVDSNQTAYADHDGTTGAGLGPVNGQTYSYRIRAFNTSGVSAPSNVETVTVGPPTPPVNVTAAGISNSRIDVSWTDGSNNESGFKIERCQGPAAGCPDSAFTLLVTLGAGARSYSDTGLAQQTTYSYRMRAFNGAGDSVASPAVSATTLQSNLVLNGGFEADANGDGAPDDWHKSSKFKRAGEVVRTGAFAGRLQRSGDLDGIVIKQIVPGIAQGVAYEFSGCVNIPSSTTGVQFFWELKWRDATGGVVKTELLQTYTTSTGGIWDCVVKPGLVAPAATTQVDVRMGVTPGTYTIYVDDVLFRPDGG
jgi:hypothetical protein